MYLGRPIEHGARAEVFETPLHPYARAPGEQPVDRSAPSLQARRGQGRAALAAGAAAWLRVPSALPVRQRTLSHRGAEAPVLSRHAPTCTPVTRSRSAACPTCRDRRGRGRVAAAHATRAGCAADARRPDALLGPEGGHQMRRSTGQAAHSNERVRRGARDRRRASSRGVAAAWRAPAGRAASAPGKQRRGRLTARQIERAP